MKLDLTNLNIDTLKQEAERTEVLINQTKNTLAVYEEWVAELTNRIKELASSTIEEIATTVEEVVAKVEETVEVVKEEVKKAAPKKAAAKKAEPATEESDK